MKFGQMILRKIIKIVPTKCQILKCTKLDFGELTALPRPSWNKGVLLLREGEGAGKGGEGGERRRGRGKGRKGQDRIFGLVRLFYRIAFYSDRSLAQGRKYLAQGSQTQQA